MPGLRPGILRTHGIPGELRRAPALMFAARRQARDRPVLGRAIAAASSARSASVLMVPTISRRDFFMAAPFLIATPSPVARQRWRWPSASVIRTASSSGVGGDAPGLVRGEATWPPRVVAPFAWLYICAWFRSAARTNHPQRDYLERRRSW